LAELQLAQAETASYFRILPNLPAAWAGNKGLALHLQHRVGGVERSAESKQRILRKESSFVLLKHHYKDGKTTKTTA